MVLSGDMVIGDTVFYPGDFHAATAGVKHPPLTSLNGGVIFIRGPIYDGIRERMRGHRSIKTSHRRRASRDRLIASSRTWCP